MTASRNDGQPRPGQDPSEWEDIRFHGSSQQDRLGHLLEAAESYRRGEGADDDRQSPPSRVRSDLSDKYVAQTLGRMSELKGYGRLKRPAEKESKPQKEEEEKDLPEVKLAEPDTGWGPFKKTLATTMASAVLLLGGYQLAHQMDKPTQPGQPAHAAEVIEEEQATAFEQLSSVYEAASSYASKARDLEQLSPEARTGAQIANERLLRTALEQDSRELQLAALLANVKWAQTQYADKFLWLTARIENLEGALRDRRTGQVLAPVYEQMAEDVKGYETGQKDLKAGSINVLSEQAAFYRQLAEQGKRVVRDEDLGPDQLADLEEQLTQLKEDVPERGPEFRSGYTLVLEQALETVQKLRKQHRSGSSQLLQS